MYCVLEAELLVYLAKIIQGMVADCVLCVGGRALNVSDYVIQLTRETCWAIETGKHQI